MYLIHLDSFLDSFISKKEYLTFNQFRKDAFVKKSNGTIVRIKDYLPKKIIKIVYEQIYLKKWDYLANFYKKSLQIMNTMAIADEPMRDDFSNHVNPKYKNIIRNLYYREILEYTETDIPNLRPFLLVITELFRDNIFDYKIVSNASIKMLQTSTSLGSILSGYFFRSSIMNPYLVFSLNKTLLKGSKIFTPTLGWSSYMYGFLESGITEYVGVDVIPKVCSVTKALATELYYFKNIKIYCKPSEDLLLDINFLKTYKRHFDTIFFSPPYYRLELYSGGLQSTERYSSYDEWLEKYWENTIKLCHYVGERQCKLCYIISNYDTYPTMVDDMNRITNRYFRFLKKMILQSGKKFSHSKNDEIIFLFEKV